MEETLKLLSGLKNKYPHLREKVENLVDILANINYKLNKVEEEDIKFKEKLNEILNEDPRKFLEEKKININTSSTSSIYYSQRGGFTTPTRSLFISFNDLIIEVITMVNNLIDLYLTINYNHYPYKNKHWDLGNFLNKKFKFHNRKFDFSNDTLQNDVNNAKRVWLDYTLDLRDSKIHRISKKQKISFMVEIEFWAKELNFPDKRTIKVQQIGSIKEDMLGLSKGTVISMLGLSKNILKRI